MMSLVSVLLLAAGIFLLGLTLFDAFRTAMAAGGGGPLTDRLAQRFWHVALRLHRRKQKSEKQQGGRSDSEEAGRPEGLHGVLSRVGPTVLLGIILTWVVLSVVAYFLMYSADPLSVVRASTNAPAGFWERLYFAGFTVSTLGLGDFAPQGAAARMLTVLASLNGFFVMTLTVTYAIPVISAVVAKRRLATSIGGLGQTPEAILRAGWDGESLDSLEQPLVDLASKIEMHTQRHLAYPILHVFHVAQPRAAVAPRLAALSEALRLMRHLPEDAQPPPASRHAARSAIDGFLAMLRDSFVPSEERYDPPERPVAAPLRAMGLPVSPEKGTGEKGNGELSQQERRRLLHVLVRDDGWTWEDVTGREEDEAFAAA